MGIFSMLLSVLISSQLAAAAPARMAKNTLSPAISRQIERAILSDNTRMLANLLNKSNLSVNDIVLHDSKKTSMLVFAAMNRKVNIVRYLAEQGAELIDVNWHPSGVKYKDTLINFANISGNKSIAAILEGIKIRLSQNFLDEKSISAAAVSGDIDLIQNFLSNFEEVGEDRDKRLLAKKILDAAMLTALKSKELAVVDTIISWQLSATTKEYLANLPPEMRPMHDAPTISKAISLAKDIEVGQLYRNLAKTIARIGNVIPTATPASAPRNAPSKRKIKLSKLSKEIEELWQNLLAIASRNAGEEFAGWKFKEKHKIVTVSDVSIKRGLLIQLDFSKIEAIANTLKKEGADGEELDELLLDFAEFTPVIANPKLMAVKLEKTGKSGIDAAVEYALGLHISGSNTSTDNLKMIYTGLKNLGNKEYIEHFEQLIDAQILERIR